MKVNLLKIEKPQSPKAIPNYQCWMVLGFPFFQEPLFKESPCFDNPAAKRFEEFETGLGGGHMPCLRVHFSPLVAGLATARKHPSTVLFLAGVVN